MARIGSEADPDTLPEKEAERRANETLRRMLTTPRAKHELRRRALKRQDAGAAKPKTEHHKRKGSATNAE